MNETADAPQPPDASGVANDDAAPPPSMRGRRGGCLLRIVIALAVIVGLIAAIGFYFDEGDSADQPQRGYDAGPASAYAPADVTQIPPQHLFVVRLQDGTFLAFYDKSPRQQELGGDCRITYDEKAVLGGADPVPGFTGGFSEACEGQSRTVWRADGEFAFGAGYGTLDRFDTSVDDAGDLIIDTDHRTCTRSLGASGIPPFQELRCGKGN